ncbi:MAG: glycosyltransferase family 39 protein [Planctomycetota bacterium]|nr:glycosyltransferase family 39 protein [Planctomycetota bacterium]
MGEAAVETCRQESHLGGRGLGLALTLVALAIFVARLIYALSLPGPWFLPDEVSYLGQAHAVAVEGSVFSYGLYGGGQPGWPVVLAPVLWVLGDRPCMAYTAGVVLSSLIGMLIVFPLFALAHRGLSKGEAVATAALACILPGSCLYGWTVLSEPLYTLVVVCAAAWLVRAVETEKTADFAGAALMAGLSYWVRPFGMAAILACLVGVIVWGVVKRRWRGPLAALLASVAVLGVGLAWKATSGPASLTNYGALSERSAIDQVLAYLSEWRGWANLATSVGRDLAYLFVATFGVLFSLALSGAGRGILGFRRLAPREKCTLAAGLAFLILTVVLTAVARLGTPELNGTTQLARMYGRYVEPLLPLVVVAGIVAWRRWLADRPAGRSVLIVVLVLVLILGLTLPKGATSFANSPGFWYWYLIYQYTPAFVALAVPAAVWLAFSLLDRRRLAAMALLVAAGAVSTALVAYHIYHYNSQTQPLRDAVAEAVVAVHRESRPHTHTILWIDPTLGATGSPFAAQVIQVTCWLSQGLPEVDMRFARQEQVVSVGDLLLTMAGRDEWARLWDYRGLGIFRVEHPGSWASSGGAVPPGEMDDIP